LSGTSVNYHSSSYEHLKTLLKTQPISVTTEKAISGQNGHKHDGDQLNSDLSSVQENTWGCRLAWSRLVDLGSIDSGSNPGSPTIKTYLDFWSPQILKLNWI
jgi:hypothetical protein